MVAETHVIIIRVIVLQLSLSDAVRQHAAGHNEAYQHGDPNIAPRVRDGGRDGQENKADKTNTQNADNTIQLRGDGIIPFTSCARCRLQNKGKYIEGSREVRQVRRQAQCASIGVEADERHPLHAPQGRRDIEEAAEVNV